MWASFITGMPAGSVTIARLAVEQMLVLGMAAGECAAVGVVAGGRTDQCVHMLCACLAFH